MPFKVMDLKKKFSKLKKIIKEIDSVLIAYSGGVDSAFLLRVASEVLPKGNLLAVTANSATYPKEELLFSKRLAKSLRVRHKIIQTDELKDKRFTANPINRCYYCKSELFQKLKGLSKKFKLNFVADASNVSDKSDFRPGSRAKKELKVRSPLQEAGLSKDEIRKLSRKLGLPTWDKPAQACLASRIPYGRNISPEVLNRIDKAEVYLRSLGLKQVRLRHYNGLCRIEVFYDDIPKLMQKRNLIVERLKELGYNYITVDLEGYRSGSMNEVRKK